MSEGILHVYHPARNLNVFEHLPHAKDSTTRTAAPPPKNVLLFVGGLYDNFNVPRYVNDLAALFPINESQEWRVMHVQLSSNGRSFGVFDIDRDIEEIASCIEFLRNKLVKNPKLNIILMGHSTGCQDIMRYLSAPNPVSDKKSARPVIQGAILQAPVSDRDAALHSIEEGPNAKSAYEAAMKIVSDTPESARRDTILPMNLTKPLYGPAPLSISRFLDLTSPDSPKAPSIEDFFSNDLSEAQLRKTFGNIGRNKLLFRPTSDGPRDTQSILILMSDSDEHVPPKINQRQLLGRWRDAMREESGATVHGDSAAILNAMHDIGGDDWPSQEARLVVLRKKILHYLRFVVGKEGVHKDADDIWHTDGDRVMKMKIGDGRSVEDQVGVLKL